MLYSYKMCRFRALFQAQEASEDDPYVGKEAFQQVIMYKINYQKLLLQYNMFIMCMDHFVGI